MEAGNYVLYSYRYKLCANKFKDSGSSIVLVRDGRIITCRDMFRFIIFMYTFWACLFCLEGRYMD